ncbi:hypothetical protein ASD30_19025 [Nocardioides sp. Root140]|nr:hypothetical protein ASD30_19025 [Nocardioides sp. Root140]
MSAVGVEHVDRAVLADEHHELGAERGDRVRLPVAEVPGQAQAVPAPREPRLDLGRLDGADLVLVDLGY